MDTNDFVHENEVQDNSTMYLNENIQINWELVPNSLKQTYNDLKEFKREGKEVLFDSYVEGFESHVKEAYIDGKIDRKMVDDLFALVGV